MRVGFVSGSLSRNGGGVFEIELALSQELFRRGNDVQVFGIADENWEADKSRWEPIPCFAFPSRRLAGFSWSPALHSAVHASKTDLLHLHALWTHASLVTQIAGKRSGCPYVVTPNGMLEPWALNNSRWKKRLAAALYERRTLRNAGCIQANTAKELNDIRRFGVDGPVAVIPNGVYLPDLPPENTISSNRQQVLLYLGRLHPKKGLSNLLHAWKRVRDVSEFANWTLVVAGWDQNGHEHELRSLASDLGFVSSDISHVDNDTLFMTEHSLDCDVAFAGPLFGARKDRWLRLANAFVLPSLSEGLPMSVLEAWSYGKPVLITDQCNLPQTQASAAGFVVEPTPMSLANGVRSIFELSPAERQEMGSRGRRLVEKEYSWPRIAQELESVYRWLVLGEPRPSCVEMACK